MPLLLISSPRQFCVDLNLRVSRGWERTDVGVNPGSLTNLCPALPCPRKPMSAKDSFWMATWRGGKWAERFPTSRSPGGDSKRNPQRGCGRVGKTGICPLVDHTRTNLLHVTGVSMAKGRMNETHRRCGLSPGTACPCAARANFPSQSRSNRCERRQRP